MSVQRSSVRIPVSAVSEHTSLAGSTLTLERSNA